MFKLASLCLFNLIVNIVLGENYKLLSTFIVIRHGDRTVFPLFLSFNLYRLATLFQMDLKRIGWNTEKWEN